MRITLGSEFKPWLVAGTEAHGRPSAQHVLFCACPRGEATDGLAVATDSHRMVIVPCLLEKPPKELPPVLIPAVWLERAAKSRPAGAFSVVIEIDFKKKCASAETQAYGVITTPLSDLQFPAWQRVVEYEFNRPSCPAAQDDWHYFSPKQLHECGRALGLDNGHALSWFQRGPTCPLMIIPPAPKEFSGMALLMPSNVTLDLYREQRITMVERTLCPRIGDATLDALANEYASWEAEEESAPA